MTWTPTIEPNIPIPEQKRGKGAAKGSKFLPRIPWEDLEPGHSLFVPADVIDKKRLSFRVSNFGNRHGWKFSIRAWDQEGRAGHRVWRTG
jgi:hypothetical protein